MFKKAIEQKLRFDSAIGSLSTEDLFDLPLTGRGANLDDVAKTINKQLKSEDESFVSKTASSEKIKMLQLKLEIVKEIIADKLAEADAAKTRKEKLAKKQVLLEILAKKQNAELEGKSADELIKMINEL